MYLILRESKSMDLYYLLDHIFHYYQKNTINRQISFVSNNNQFTIYITKLNSIINYIDKHIRWFYFMNFAIYNDFILKHPFFILYHMCYSIGFNFPYILFFICLPSKEINVFDEICNIISLYVYNINIYFDFYSLSHK